MSLHIVAAIDISRTKYVTVLKSRNTLYAYLMATIHIYSSSKFSCIHLQIGSIIKLDDWLSYLSRLIRLDVRVIWNGPELLPLRKVN